MHAWRRDQRYFPESLLLKSLQPVSSLQVPFTCKKNAQPDKKIRHMKFLLISTICLLLLYLGAKTYNYFMMADGLAKKVRNGAVILDVRTATEYNRGHIPGSVNIALGAIRERYTELDPEKTYITTCSHGLRSVKAVQLLQERGFKQVYNGGAWSDLQQQLEKAGKRE